ncbi:hypothetical protein NECAME_14514, partial [Necator americanus]
MQQPAQAVFPVAAPCYSNPSQQGPSAVGTHTFRGEKCVSKRGVHPVLVYHIPGSSR